MRNAKSKIPEEWSKHLTDERREAFEKTGEAYVRNNAQNSNYGSKEANLAAKAWVAELDSNKESRESFRYWLLFAVAFLSFIAAAMAIPSERINSLKNFWAGSEPVH